MKASVGDKCQYYRAGEWEAATRPPPPFGSQTQIRRQDFIHVFVRRVTAPGLTVSRDAEDTADAIVNGKTVSQL